MTREEAKECMDFDSNAERMSTKRNNALIDKIYDSFEKRIKSLEAYKTCEWKDDGYFFDTQCGYHIYIGDNGFEDVDMRDPSFKFCPYCGSVIKRMGELK